MYLGNLSFDLLQKYLEMLSICGLLQQRNGPDRTYMVTEKGQRFLEDFYELEKHSEVVESKKRLLEKSLTST
jgi:predicted transcriptional regulator